MSEIVEREHETGRRQVGGGQNWGEDEFIRISLVNFTQTTVNVEGEGVGEGRGAVWKEEDRRRHPTEGEAIEEG